MQPEIHDKIVLRHQLDEMMTNLDQVPKEKKASTYLRAGRLMVQLGILPKDYDKDIQVIVAAYEDYLHKQTNAARKDI